MYCVSFASTQLTIITSNIRCTQRFFLLYTNSIMSHFKVLDNVDQITENTVFGYIRRCQSLLDDENKIIAPLIYHLCLLYFYINEYWTAFDEKLFQLNETKDTFIKIGSGCGSVYGNIRTNPAIKCIYKCKLQFLDKIKIHKIFTDYVNTT